jgi:DNA-binding MarR family transcriptional regulator
LSASREAVGLALGRLQRLLSSRTVHASWSRAAGVDLPQQATQVLRVLDAHSPLPVAEVARVARMDAGAVSRQLRLLDEADLIERRPSPTNGSVVLVALTEGGAALRQRMADAGARQLSEALREWSEADQQRLAALLTRLADDLASTPYRSHAP